MWFAHGRIVVAGAMPAHPAYDGAMFLAYLTIVPSMTAILMIVAERSPFCAEKRHLGNA